MSKCPGYPKYNDCSECELTHENCHPLQIALAMEKRKTRGSFAALERKELEILKKRRNTTKTMGDDIYYMICAWIDHKSDVTLNDISSALESYKREYNRMRVSEERCKQYQEKQKK